MKINRVCVIILIICVQIVNCMKTCRCWKSYKPQPIDDHFKCYSKETFHWMSCNVAQPPKCACTGNSSNVLKDRSGTWCTLYMKGQEMNRWPCENNDEWVQFFRNNKFERM